MGNIVLVQVGANVLKALIAEFSKSNLPAEIIDGATQVVQALEAHKDDLITKANLEAQRG